jgi:hypothetical protein
MPPAARDFRSDFFFATTSATVALFVLSALPLGLFVKALKPVGMLAYRGQYDASRPANGVPVTGADLNAACVAVLAGEPTAAAQAPSLGCSIKWRADRAPDWA